MGRRSVEAAPDMACCCYLANIKPSLHQCVSVPNQLAGQQHWQSLPVSVADAAGLATFFLEGSPVSVYCCSSPVFRAYLLSWHLGCLHKVSIKLCGCTAGHMTHWRRCLESEEPQGMAVCENGACITGTFPLQRLACWTGQPFGRPSPQVSAGVVLSGHAKPLKACQNHAAVNIIVRCLGC